MSARRFLSIALAVSLIANVAFAVFAFVQKKQADEARADADQMERIAAMQRVESENAMRQAQNAREAAAKDCEARLASNKEN